MEIDLFLQKLFEKDIRISLETEDKLRKLKQEELAKIWERIGNKKNTMISWDDIQHMLEKKEVIVKRFDSFKPIAKEYDPDIKIYKGLDVTKKSVSKGEVSDFIRYFKNRYERMRAMVMNQTNREYAEYKIGDIGKIVDKRARIKIAGLLYEKKETKKGNILLKIEDDTGIANVVVIKREKEGELFAMCDKLMLDEMLAIEADVITGMGNSQLLIAKEIYQPNIPYAEKPATCEKDVAIAYLSDLHIGSKKFLEKELKKFIEWTKGNGPETKVASKLKYIIVAGDIVDGIGIYPNQEKDLLIPDVEKQYELFDKFVNEIPDYIEIIVSPGNHDAVRRADPQPAIPDDLIKSPVLKISSPSYVSIEGIDHLVYHGTSIDMMISDIPGLSYMKPELVMVEMLKRRHLSPTYGGDISNPIIPEPFDYLIIDKVPNIVHMGHVHKNGYFNYRNCLVINSGTFQDQTDFQIRMGHKPSPGIVPIYEAKYSSFKTIRFLEQG